MNKNRRRRFNWKTACLRLYDLFFSDSNSAISACLSLSPPPSPRNWNRRHRHHHRRQHQRYSRRTLHGFHNLRTVADSGILRQSVDSVERFWTFCPWKPTFSPYFLALLTAGIGAWICSLIKVFGWNHKFDFKWPVWDRRTVPQLLVAVLQRTRVWSYIENFAAGGFHR